MALLEFYGKECPHCERMNPLIEKLEKEERVSVKKYETWHDEENAKLFNDTVEDRCPGVPFFLNTDSDQFICGEADYETVKKWAEGGKV